MYHVSAAPDSVMIAKGMGTHYIQVQLQVGIPEVSTDGRAAARSWKPRFTPRRAPQSARVNRSRSANVSLQFNPTGEIRLPMLLFLVTNAQVQALEKHRNGDLRLELQVNAVLPQASSGFPGATQVTEYITIAESRWRQQLAGLGRTLGAEMLIPFPDDDEPRQAVAASSAKPSACSGAERSTAQCSRCARLWRPSRTPAAGTGPARRRRERSRGERWALIRSAMEDQASGPCTWMPALRTRSTPGPRSRRSSR